MKEDLDLGVIEGSFSYETILILFVLSSFTDEVSNFEAKTRLRSLSVYSMLGSASLNLSLSQSVVFELVV